MLDAWGWIDSPIFHFTIKHGSSHCISWSCTMTLSDRSADTRHRVPVKLLDEDPQPDPLQRSWYSTLSHCPQKKKKKGQQSAGSIWVILDWCKTHRTHTVQCVILSVCVCICMGMSVLCVWIVSVLASGKWDAGEPCHRSNQWTQTSG